MQRTILTRRRPSSRKSWLRRHIFALLIIALAITSSALFVSYANWKQINDAQANTAAQELEFMKLDKQVALTKQRKIEAALKAEAEAKAKAEEDARRQSRRGQEKTCRYDACTSKYYALRGRQPKLDYCRHQ